MPQGTRDVRLDVTTGHAAIASRSSVATGGASEPVDGGSKRVHAMDVPKAKAER